jgi:hypothetical protein
MQGKRSEESILRDPQRRPSRKGPNKATREPKRERERGKGPSFSALWTTQQQYLPTVLTNSTSIHNKIHSRISLEKKKKKKKKNSGPCPLEKQQTVQLREPTTNANRQPEI